MQLVEDRKMHIGYVHAAHNRYILYLYYITRHRVFFTARIRNKSQYFNPHRQQRTHSYEITSYTFTLP